MNKFQRDIIELVRCSLTGEKAEIKDLDYINVYKFSIVNQIIGLVFPAISKDENFAKSEIYNKFFSSYMFYVSASEKQLYELNLLYDEFNKNNINYVPLKGSVLKKLYPSPEMRTMGDADILVDLSQIDTINSIMQNLGYTFQYESDHELGWHKGNELHLELHKRLIPSYNKDYYEYYGDGWKIVKDNKIGLEDNFIFLFTHFAKHYRDKGVGLKYIVDFYVYINKYKDLNFSYI